ncbi:MAG: hypothetical protein WCJ25_00590 [Candidatus Moraniibacteriota bacterium]
MRIKRNVLNGFSLAETMLSMTVLIVGILPILAAMNGGLKHSLESRSIITASGLAQEGVELLKNVKDNNAFAGGTSLAVWLPPSGGPTWNDCRIDFNDNAVSTTGFPVSCGQSNFSLSGTPYVHGGGSGKFNRRIFLSYDSTNETVDCISVVYWGSTYVPSTTMADVRSQCSASNACAYAETTLTPWE